MGNACAAGGKDPNGNRGMEDKYLHNQKMKKNISNLTNAHSA